MKLLIEIDLDKIDTTQETAYGAAATICRDLMRLFDRYDSPAATVQVGDGSLIWYNEDDEITVGTWQVAGASPLSLNQLVLYRNAVRSGRIEVRSKSFMAQAKQLEARGLVKTFPLGSGRGYLVTPVER